MNSASISEKAHCFSEGEKKIYTSRLILRTKDVFSTVDEALLLLCGGERKQILNSYSELLLKCDKLIETLNEFQLNSCQTKMVRQFRWRSWHSVQSLK